MAFAHSTGNHEYWYDPDKKEFVLTLFKTDEDGKDHSYLVKPDNIVQAATMLDEYGDEDYSLYDMLKFLKDNNVMDDYTSVAKELAERYSDQPPVWLDEGNIDSALGLADSSIENKKTMTCADYASGNPELREYLEKVLGNGEHTYEDLEDIEKEFYDDQETDVSNIAKSLTANDLGRSF